MPFSGGYSWRRAKSPAICTVLGGAASLRQPAIARFRANWHDLCTGAPSMMPVTVPKFLDAVERSGLIEKARLDEVLSV